MLTDSKIVEELRDSWTTVRTADGRFRLGQDVALSGFAFPDPEVAKLVASLLVVMAYSVLEETLLALRDQGVFSAGSSRLADLMRSSRPGLAWRDYQAIELGRQLRNAIAHERKFLPAKECARLLDLVEAELIGWQVLSGRIKVPWKFEFKPNS